MKLLREISDLKDKKVLLRVDFDVPVVEGSISETFRIEKQKETLEYLLDKGARVVMMAHVSATDSFGGLMPQLHLILGKEINFLKKIEDIEIYLDNYAGPALLENIRQFPGEKENDEGLALNLSKGFDLYVNNAFAVCHRNHASVSAITKFLPSYAGFLIEEETARLRAVIDSPKEGKVIIMGGAKASTKIPVIKNFLDKADKILIGGVIANDILKGKGQDVGDSVVDENASELLAGLDLNSSQLVMPKDYNISEKKILDIGPEAIKEFSGIIKNSKMIIWNGPMGLFEDGRFAEGTAGIAGAIAESEGVKIIGGGDTITAVDKLGFWGKFKSKQIFISTGGGAMLSFLAGENLPGLVALRYD